MVCLDRNPASHGCVFLRNSCSTPSTGFELCACPCELADLRSDCASPQPRRSHSVVGLRAGHGHRRRAQA
eukprot:22535-Eustigmatos_ZCMA.PRE.1